MLGFQPFTSKEVLIAYSRRIVYFLNGTAKVQQNLINKDSKKYLKLIDYQNVTLTLFLRGYCKGTTKTA